MALRKSLWARLEALSPPVVGGGVLHIDDLKSGTVRLEDLPRSGGGYLLMLKPCQSAAEWARRYAGVQSPYAPTKETP